MPNPQTPPTPGGAPTPSGMKGLEARAGGRRNLLLAAAAGTALVAYLMSRSGGGSSSDAADQIMMGYDSTPYDQYNGLQSQIEDIQRQLDEGTMPADTPAPVPASPKPPITTLPWPKPVAKPLPVSRPATRTPAKPVRVTIKKGDTLSGIAKKAGISMATLKKLNPVFWTNPKYKNGNRIWSGGHVRIK